MDIVKWGWTVCFYGLVLLSMADAADWYTKYDARSFAASRVANQAINFRKVDQSLLNAAVFHAANEIREANRLPLFVHSRKLDRVARGHSKAMLKHDFFSHESPVKGRETITKRLEAEGLKNVAGAENLALTFGIDLVSWKPYYPPSQNDGYFSYEVGGKPILPFSYIGFGRSIVRHWMGSAGHRRNLLDPRFRFLGHSALQKKRKTSDEVPKFMTTQNFSSAVE